MSSQDSSGIPVSHAPDGTGYKLLELPPELLELLESADPPILTLHPSPESALLRTPHRTYSLRQKNTSNALILLAPAGSPDAGGNGSGSGSGGSNSAVVGQVGPGLRAVATVHETIDLVPEAESPAAAAAAPKVKGKWHEKFGRGR